MIGRHSALVLHTAAGMAFQKETKRSDGLCIRFAQPAAAGSSAIWREWLCHHFDHTDRPCLDRSQGLWRGRDRRKKMQIRSLEVRLSSPCVVRLKHLALLLGSVVVGARTCRCYRRRGTYWNRRPAEVVGNERQEARSRLW